MYVVIFDVMINVYVIIGLVILFVFNIIKSFKDWKWGIKCVVDFYVFVDIWVIGLWYYVRRVRYCYYESYYECGFYIYCLLFKDIIILNFCFWLFCRYIGLICMVIIFWFFYFRRWDSKLF